MADLAYKEPRYHGRLAVTSFGGVTIRDLLPVADHLVDRLAREHDIGRSAIVRYVLEHMAEHQAELFEEIVTARLGEPAPKGRRHKVLAPPVEVYEEPSQQTACERDQDRVCREINGSAALTGCRYPSCDCKG